MNAHTYPQHREKKGLVFYVIYTFILCTLLFLISGAVLFFYYSHHLPDFTPLKERRLNAYSVVYSEEDEVVGKFLMDNRIPVSYEQVPKLLVKAFTAAEDAEFFQHKGVDYKGILRAMFKNLLAGRIVQGGSTITQQVTKTFFLTPKRSLHRKLREVAYAFGLERDLTKEEILTLYLNNIYLGNGAYGVEAASESYFNKRIDQLQLAEMAMMAGLAKAPSRYSPVTNFRRARDRQAYVLTRMTELGMISQDQREKALRTPLKIQSRESAYFSKAPYFTEFIRQQVERKYGKEKLYQQGLRIYTTLDLPLQRAAQRSVEAGLRELDKREGFRGPLRTLPPKEVKELLHKKKESSRPLPSNEVFEGVILFKDESNKLFTIWVEDRKGILPFSEMSWALTLKPTPSYKPQKVKTAADLLNPGDVVYVRVKESPKKDQPPLFTLEQDPLVQGALLCLDPKTGYVRAMVGGRDFSESQFNRAISSRRQPGSAFKPIIYLTALTQVFKPDIMLRDAPLSFVDAAGNLWQPSNYNNEYFGDVTMRTALEHSLNSATVRLLEKVGVSNVISQAKSLHINSDFAPNLSLALGSTEVSPLDLAGAYATIARGGTYVALTTIRNVLTNQGEELRREAVEERVITPETAFTLIDMMKGVVKRGTAAKAAKMPYFLAGKTGTTNEFRDAWFVGFSPNLLCLVWVGYDKDAVLGKRESGATAALPIWMEFMSKALPLYPNDDFASPDKEKEETIRYVYPPGAAEPAGTGQAGAPAQSHPKTQ